MQALKKPTLGLKFFLRILSTLLIEMEFAHPPHRRSSTLRIVLGRSVVLALVDLIVGQSPICLDVSVYLSSVARMRYVAI